VAAGPAPAETDGVVALFPLQDAAQTKRAASSA
jgi:hypothetical protein